MSDLSMQLKMILAEIIFMRAYITTICCCLYLQDSLGSLICTVADIQSLLVTVMRSIMRTIVSQKSPGSASSGQTEQWESWCLVDAAIAFCKLQHLDPSVSIKTQVKFSILSQKQVCGFFSSF